MQLTPAVVVDRMTALLSEVAAELSVRARVAGAFSLRSFPREVDWSFELKARDGRPRSRSLQGSATRRRGQERPHRGPAIVVTSNRNVDYCAPPSHAPLHQRVRIAASTFCEDAFFGAFTRTSTLADSSYQPDSFFNSALLRTFGERTFGP